jgi:hypothetical protein
LATDTNKYLLLLLLLLLQPLLLLLWPVMSLPSELKGTAEIV